MEEPNNDKEKIDQAEIQHKIAEEQHRVVEEERELIEENLPAERKQITEIVRNLSNELMEYKQRVNTLQEELRSAVRRKKAKSDPLIGKYGMVLFSYPKVKSGEEKTKVRMHTADNVKGAEALQSVRRLMKDPDNDFVGAYLLLEMKGKKDGYARLQKNTEGAYHLFKCLNDDLELYDPKKKKDQPEGENPYADSENKDSEEK